MAPSHVIVEEGLNCKIGVYIPMYVHRYVHTNNMRKLLNEKIETKRLLLVPVSLKYKEDVFKEFNESITKYMYPKPSEENMSG